MRMHQSISLSVVSKNAGMSMDVEKKERFLSSRRNIDADSAQRRAALLILYQLISLESMN